MTLMIDTPDGIAFARAAARLGALKLEANGMTRGGRSALSIVKEVYGLTGSRPEVTRQLDEYVEGTLTIRKWPEAYGQRMQAILNGIIDVLPAGYTKDDIDHEVQGGFARGFITEQEGNDACLLLFVDVVRTFAGRR